MCGIAGIVDSRADAGVDESMIHRMCQTIVHRGPNDEGIFVKGGCGLGMRRLSVIDLSGGHQPVFNEDRTVWVVFNGEIYNFQELRGELESHGHRFYTRSDTEVIVHLYEDMGSECVQKLRGMFAFALYDEHKRRLFVARDRIGKKPLHYAMSNGRLIFASEIKAILSAAPKLADIDRDAVLQYFYFGYITDPSSAFKAIKKLPPGHFMEFENGRLSIHQYWDFPQYGTYSPSSEEECLQELEERLEEAVRIRLIADVPLGAMLSGGTDSSTVVALMAKNSSKPVKTFAVGFSEGDFNEAPFARKVAEKFGTEHHELMLEPNVMETVNTLTRSLEEPFGDSSMLPTYFVSRLARRYVTVALSGDGGDEAFAGYERYRIHLQDRAYEWIPEWARHLYRDKIHSHVPLNLPGRSLAYSVSLQWQDRYTEGISLQPFQRQMDILSSDFVGDAKPLKPFRVLLDEAPGQDPLERVLYLDSKTYLPGDILTKVDRMSMLTSLEVRVPMLDHVFLELVTSLTVKWKMQGTNQKYILKRLAERVGVPREVLHRRKQGFALPMKHWIRHEMKDLILTIMLEPRTLQRGYFNPEGVRRLLDEHFNQRRDHSARIWRLLMFELWHRNFLDDFHAASTNSTEPLVEVRERSVEA